MPFGSRTVSNRCHCSSGETSQWRRSGLGPKAPPPPATRPAGAKVQRTAQPLARFDVLARLGNSQRAWVAGLLWNPLRHLAVERIDRIEGEIAAMNSGTVRIPGLLRTIGLLPEFDAVRRHAFKTAVEDLLANINSSRARRDTR